MTYINFHSSIFKRFLLFIAVIVIFNSCDKTEEDTPAKNETGTMTDIDGNIYKTVKIGNQWWMAENLKVKKYRNGDLIPEITDSLGWVSLNSGGYCIYNNGNNNTPPPGLLYNWKVISNASGIAPDGWHIPTDEEWKQLEQSLGMSSSDAEKLTWRGNDEGDKLKSEDQDEWSLFGNLYPTNESGFSALAGSCRLFNNTWGDPGLKTSGFWWTASDYGNDQAWYRNLDYKSSKVFRSHTSRFYGFSIRCVKN